MVAWAAVRVGKDSDGWKNVDILEATKPELDWSLTIIVHAG